VKKGRKYAVLDEKNMILKKKNSSKYQQNSGGFELGSVIHQPLSLGKKG
jgi:hypothetical protein